MADIDTITEIIQDALKIIFYNVYKFMISLPNYRLNNIIGKQDEVFKTENSMLVFLMIPAK